MEFKRRIDYTKYNSNYEDIQIYISPCIHECCFEVDKELKDEYIKKVNDYNFKHNQ